MAEVGVHLVTGAASGIGLAIVRHLVGQGRRVVACDRDEETLRHLADREGWRSPQVGLQAFDVRDMAAWQAAIKAVETTLGPIEVLYNVAGYLRPGYVMELAPDDIDRHFDVNVKGVVYGTHAALQRMLGRRRGHIVNLASMAALAPIHGLSLYSASKHAVRAFSLAAAYELRPHGIAVTVVCPDAVATPMLARQTQHRAAAMTFSAPRVLSAEEVAEALVGPVLRKRPLEFILPRPRGWLAKLANLMPALSQWAGPWIERQGRKQQQKRQGNVATSGSPTDAVD